ncbi:uncharacterized protein CTHT_0003160 [Thermochaetoides thermophila DSM 1495]|uniref:Uncharacterized protein n=1 Tax=Chaetomium thermophilum (strain DSM 1495 / CBS 144.50 / IMI 039719) TaxID=759272 RepID=G0RZJ3_CHATD|nr:hypothetical protein CTHT_0003160 [Thermochaetoides thermophila DSM 1495]EGS23621.1 hypothetical protein CTHT_0003160 [Thermochaetoides thermophila DSM 1495]
MSRSDQRALEALCGLPVLICTGIGILVISIVDRLRRPWSSNYQETVSRNTEALVRKGPNDEKDGLKSQEPYRNRSEDVQAEGRQPVDRHEPQQRLTPSPRQHLSSETLQQAEPVDTFTHSIHPTFDIAAQTTALADNRARLNEESGHGLIRRTPTLTRLYESIGAAIPFINGNGSTNADFYNNPGHVSPPLGSPDTVLSQRGSFSGAPSVRSRPISTASVMSGSTAGSPLNSYGGQESILRGVGTGTTSSPSRSIDQIVKSPGQELNAMKVEV